MPVTQIVPLVILIIMFIVATKWPVNIGIMGFVAAFFVGFFMLGMTDREILEEFPATIFLTIVGVTFFFSMAQANGTIDVIVRACVKAVGGRMALIPWVFFFIASVLTALGTFSPAAVALLAPAAMLFAAESGISGVVMGALIINGAHAGGFSPISVAGVLVREISEKNNFAITPIPLFLSSYAINLIISIIPSSSWP